MNIKTKSYCNLLPHKSKNGNVLITRVFCSQKLIFSYVKNTIYTDLLNKNKRHSSDLLCPTTISEKYDLSVWKVFLCSDISEKLDYTCGYACWISTKALSKKALVSTSIKLR